MPTSLWSGPPTSGYGTSGNIETSVVCPHPEIAALPERMPVRPPRSGVEPFRLPPRGRNLAKKANVGRVQMQRSAAVRSAVRFAVVLGVLAAGGASAQQAVTDEHLTATQKLGRAVFAQSCGICHLP